MTWKNVFYLMKILLVHFKNVRERLNVDGKKKRAERFHIYLITSEGNHCCTTIHCMT